MKAIIKSGRDYNVVIEAPKGATKADLLKKCLKYYPQLTEIEIKD